MAERKLNLNAPLLSVRRFSNIATSDEAKTKKLENSRLNRRHTLPPYKPDTSLDQVTEPVAVPFHWEQIPGRAKDNSAEQPKVAEEASATPKVPPRRSLDNSRHHKGKREPKVPKEASVTPRISSRRVLDAVKHQKEKPEPKIPMQASVTQRNPSRKVLDLVKQQKEKKPKDQSVSRPKAEANSFKENVKKLDYSREGLNEKPGLNSDDDDVYSDALEALSPTDSISMNCSASGLSGFDVPVVKPSGTFSKDRQTQDFMMSRFLPAAKAMALEPPHYASRKQPVVVEQLRQITKVVHGNRTPPPCNSQSIIVSQYGKDIEEKESEDEHDEYEGSGNISTKARGWFPRLCFKNSLGLLNPIPGLKVRTQASMSSTHDVEKPGRASPSRSVSQIVKKHFKDAANKLKQDRGGQSPRLVEAENKLSCASNRFIYANAQGCVSPYRNEAPQSPFHGRGSLGIPKEAVDFRASRLNLYKGISKSQELSSYYGAKRGSRPVSPVVEKTLHVDTVHKAGILFPYSRSSNIREHVDSGKRDVKTALKSREMKEAAGEESSFQDRELLDFLEAESEVKNNKVSGSADAVSASLSDKPDLMEDHSKALVCVSATTEENVNIDDAGNVKNSLVQSPLPPSLPKTPSESWLWRTLPSISSQNPLSHLYRRTSFQSKWQDTNTPSTNTKWENIVKSSYLHHDHVRYSEELIPHASEHLKN
ncbi:F28N24.8 PROTEIN [Salix viminalis]|uniref:F28N24.8 PROTEIN n=1 Tax=Salix viminalis TaxID=40686 RepID=A0A9Q0QIH8_SALVM|nr:F28N24.8 PROTEIN [Salix viminalis]